MDDYRLCFIDHQRRLVIIGSESVFSPFDSALDDLSLSLTVDSFFHFKLQLLIILFGSLGLLRLEDDLVVGLLLEELLRI
jgi:hypothetical protein